MEYDSAKLRLEFHKADALREIRPYLDSLDCTGLGAPSPRTKLKSLVIRYLNRIVYAHVEALLSSYPLLPGVDIEALIDKALQDAKDQVNSPVVGEIAGAVRIYLIDSARATYLSALANRTGLVVASDDNAYNKWTRQTLQGIQAGSHAREERRPGSSDFSATTTRTQAPQQPNRGVVAVDRNAEADAATIERLKRERAELLAAYKTDTGVTSDRAIYGCAGQPGTHSSHKPQFIQWKNGELSPNSQPCKSLETFLRERRRPPISPPRS